MIKSLNFLFLSLLAILTISCSNEDTDIEYDYLPVKLVGSEMWSILNVQTGEVLYKDEFKNMPSAIYHDLFLVENDKGTFDYYNINNVKTPVNKASFYMAADFVGSDVTPATLPGKQITLINTKCEVVATLDKSIERCGKFVEGLAMFMDETGKCGFLDKTGKIVIKAKYDNGLSFSDGVSVCWLVDEDEDLTTYYVIDKTGKELFKFTSNEYVIAGAFNEGRIPVFKDKEIIYLDKTGKKLQSLCNLEDTINYSSNLFNYNIFAYWSYRVPAGYEFNYNAELIGVDMEYDISEFESLEKQIADKFEAALTAKGYKQLENGYMEAPNGTAVGLGYKDGIIRLQYSFEKGNYEKLIRIPRESDGEETQEGNVDSYSDAVDSVSVDTAFYYDDTDVYDSIVAE